MWLLGNKETVTQHQGQVLFKGQNLPLSGTITFVNFYTIIMQFFALFQHL